MHVGHRGKVLLTRSIMQTSFHSIWVLTTEVTEDQSLMPKFIMKPDRHKTNQPAGVTVWLEHFVYLMDAVFLLSLWETSSVFYKCLSPWKQVPGCKDRADKGISHSHMWPSWELQGFLQEETHWPNKYKPRNLQTNVSSSKTLSSRGWVLIGFVGT